MFKTTYLFRLDDACPTLEKEKWSKVEEVFDKHDVKPMVGIVPNCKDDNLMKDDDDPHFWEKALDWQKKGWAIALHGYDHCYISDKGYDGLNPLWRRSEFAGVTLDVQKKKIRDGVAVLKEKGLDVKYFFAPSHTFDENTLTALREESDIRIISDMYTLMPYRESDFVYIPCQIGHPQKMSLPGMFTICLHPNMMKESDFTRLEAFIKKKKKKVIAFDEIDISRVGKKRIIDRLVSWAYYKMRARKVGKE